MSLTTVRNFLVKYKFVFIIVAGLAGIYLLISVYYLWVNRINPVFGKLATPNVSSLVTNSPTWYTPNLETPTINRAIVYKVETRKFTDGQAKALANKLGFVEAAKILQSRGSTTYKYTSVKRELYITLDKGEVLFKDNNKIAELFTSKTTGGFRNIDVVAKAKSYLQGLGIVIEDANISLEVDGLYYFNPTQNALEYGNFPANEGTASIVSIDFRKKIAKKYYVYTTSGYDQINVVMTKKGDIASVYLKSLSVKDVGAKYPLLSEKEVVNLMNSGKGKLAHYTKEESYLETRPDSIQVEKGKLNYYNDPKIDYLEPIFVFASQSLKGSKSYPAEVYLPAVSAKYLK